MCSKNIEIFYSLNIYLTYFLLPAWLLKKTVAFLFFSVKYIYNAIWVGCSITNTGNTHYSDSFTHWKWREQKSTILIIFLGTQLFLKTHHARSMHVRLINFQRKKKKKNNTIQYNTIQYSIIDFIYKLKFTPQQLSI